MPTKCDDTIRASIGRTAEDMAAADLAKITQRAKALKDKIDLSRNDPLAMQNVLGKFEDDVQTAKLIRRRQTALNYRATAAQRAKFASNDFAIKNPDEYMQSRFVGSQRGFAGSKDYTMNNSDREQNQRIGLYDADLEKAGISKLAYSGKNDQNLFRARWDLNHGVDPAEIEKQHGKDALLQAQIDQRHQEASRIDFNREGGWIGQNDDFITRRRYDGTKVATTGGNVHGSKEAIRSFVDWWDNHMDWSRAMDGDFADQPAQRRAMLEREFQDFLTGRHDRFDEKKSRGDMASRFAGLASRRSHDRKFVLKDADSEYEAFKMWGKDESVGAANLSMLSQMGRDIAIMRDWGPNAYQNIHKMFDHVLDHAKENAPERIEGINAVRDKFEKRYWPIMTDTTGAAKESAAAHFLSVVRSNIMAAKLSSSIFTSLPLDIPLRASWVTYYHSRSTVQFASEMMRGVAQALNVPLHGLKKSLTGSDLHGRTQGEMLNTLAEAGVRSAHIFSPLGPGAEDEFGAGMHAKFTQMVFKAGAHFAVHNRIMNNQMVADGFRHWTLRDTPYEKLPVGMQKAMDFYGLNREGWEALRKQEPFKVAGDMHVFQPSNIRNMDLEHFKGVVGKEDATETQLMRARNDVADKYRNMLGDLADRAAAGPRRDVRAYANMGTSDGTLSGELVRGFNMLKGWTWNYMKNHLGREIYGYTPERVGFTKAITRMLTGQGGGAMMGFSRLIAASTVMAGVSNNLHEMVNGETPSPWTSNQFWMKAFAKQSLGLTSDALFAALHEVNAKDPNIYKAVSSLLGPELETVMDFGQSAASAWAHHRDNKQRSFQHDIGDLTKLGYGNVPGNNLFWLKWAMDYYVLDNIMETIEPGYKQKMEQRAEKNGQHYVMMNSGGQQ